MDAVAKRASATELDQPVCLWSFWSGMSGGSLHVFLVSEDRQDPGFGPNLLDALGSLGFNLTTGFMGSLTLLHGEASTWQPTAAAI